MALILLLESATEVCSVALARDGNLIDMEENAEGLSHAELLTSFIEVILDRNKILVSNLDAVAVSKGPGSYTGLRIGVSAAKGLCYAAEIQLIAINSLESMAAYTIQNKDKYGIEGEDLFFCPMIDARRMEVYNSVYDSDGKQHEPVTASVVEKDSFFNLLKEKKVAFFGNGAAKCKELITDSNALFQGPVKTSAQFMIPLAEIRFHKQEFEDVAYFEPFYLKDFIATIPKNKIF